MRIFASLLTMIVVMALAITVGNRVPAETVALAAGVLLGALAAVPFSLAIGVVTARRAAEPVHAVEQATRREGTARSYQIVDGLTSARDYPSLVIINPSGYQTASRVPARAAAYLDATPMLSAPRQFRVVGDEPA